MKNRLRVLRAERRFTQAVLAEALGVSRQTINAVESGKYDPSLSLAFKIAAVFGVRIEDVFDPQTTEEPDEDRRGGAAAPSQAAVSRESRR